MTLLLKTSFPTAFKPFESNHYFIEKIGVLQNVAYKRQQLAPLNDIYIFVF